MYARYCCLVPNCWQRRLLSRTICSTALGRCYSPREAPRSPHEGDPLGSLSSPPDHRMINATKQEPWRNDKQRPAKSSTLTPQKPPKRPKTWLANPHAITSTEAHNRHRAVRFAALRPANGGECARNSTALRRAVRCTTSGGCPLQCKGAGSPLQAFGRFLQ